MRLLKSLSSPVLNVSNSGDSTVPLSNLFQCLTTCYFSRPRNTIILSKQLSIPIFRLQWYSPLREGALMNPVVGDIASIPKLNKYFAIYKLFFIISRSFIWLSIPLQLYISLKQNVSLMLFLSKQFCAHTQRYMCVCIYRFYIHIYIIAYIAVWITAKCHCRGSSFLSMCAFSVFSLVNNYPVLVCTWCKTHLLMYLHLRLLLLKSVV